MIHLAPWHHIDSGKMPIFPANKHFTGGKLLVVVGCYCCWLFWLGVGKMEMILFISFFLFRKMG